MSQNICSPTIGGREDELSDSAKHIGAMPEREVR